LAFFARVRARVSVPPPAAHGQTRVMSLSGKFAAGARDGSTNANMRTPAKIKTNLLNITTPFLGADDPVHPIE